MGERSKAPQLPHPHVRHPGCCYCCVAGLVRVSRPDNGLAHVHVRHLPMLLAWVCMDATHSSEGCSLKVGCRRSHTHDAQLSLHCCNRTARCGQSASASRRSASRTTVLPPPALAAAATPPLQDTRASAAHQVTGSPGARLLHQCRMGPSWVQRLRTLQLPCLFARSPSRPPPATRPSAPPVEYGAADYTACGVGALFRVYGVCSVGARRPR